MSRQTKQSQRLGVVTRLDAVAATVMRTAYRTGVHSVLGVETARRLSPRFDPTLLKRDLARVDPTLWVQHEAGYHEGAGSAVCLIGNSEDPQNVHVARDKPLMGCSLLRHTRYLREVLLSFGTGMHPAWLMKIAAGGRIFEHCDANVGVDDGFARLHVPVQSAPGNTFWLAGSRVAFRVGETWYGDFSFPHEARNNSDVDRVHLVFDARVDDSLKAIFPAGYFTMRRRRRVALALSRGGAGALGWSRRRSRQALISVGLTGPRDR